MMENSETIIVSVSGWRDSQRNMCVLSAVNVSIEMTVEYWAGQRKLKVKKFACELASLSANEDPQQLLEEIMRQMADPRVVLFYTGSMDIPEEMDIHSEAIIYQNFEPGRPIRTLIINDPQGIYNWMRRNKHRQLAFQLFLEQTK